MAKKKIKSNEPSLIKSLFAGTVMAGSVGYLGLSLYNSLSNSIELVDALLNYNWNWEWVQSQTDLIRYGIYASPLIFGMLFKAFNRKPKETYSDAAEHGVYGDATFSDLENLKENKFVPEDIEGKFRKKKSVTKWSKNRLWSKGFWKTLKIPEGIILGREGNELVVLHPDSKLDNRNVLVVGSSGSSKGQAFVIPNLINNYTSSMIVTDPKGELYKQLGDIKRDQGYVVHQIDFFNLGGSRYNPLDYVSTDMDAKKVADSISRNASKDGKEDFFFSTARDLLVGLILYAKSENPNASMYDVKHVFNKISDAEEGPDELFNLIEDIGPDHPAYQFLADASSQSGNTRASIMSSFAQQTGVFSMQAVSKFTRTSDLRFEDLQKEKTIIFVKVPVKDNPVSGLTATFFDQLFSVLYKIGDENDSILPIPTICLLDEFANLGKLNDYDNILSTCRGYRLSLMTIIQDFAQLEEKYSEKLARTFVNNHDTALFLRTKDQKTAEYFEASAGDTTVRYETKSKQGGSNLLYYLGMDNQPKQGSASRSENYQKKPLVSKSTLLNMQGDTCYVFMAGRVLELEKAFQSVIYNGFITASKPVNGKYPYVYPEHRERYMELLGLESTETFEDQSELEKVEHQNIIEAKDKVDSVSEGEGHQEEIKEDAATTVVMTTVTPPPPVSNGSTMSAYAKSLLLYNSDQATTIVPKQKTETDVVSKGTEGAENGVEESVADEQVQAVSMSVEDVLKDRKSVIVQQALAFQVLETVDEINNDESSETAHDLTQILKRSVKTVRQSNEAYEMASESDDVLGDMVGMLDGKGSVMQSEEVEPNEQRPNLSIEEEDYPM